MRKPSFWIFNLLLSSFDDYLSSFPSYKYDSVAYSITAWTSRGRRFWCRRTRRWRWIGSTLLITIKIGCDGRSYLFVNGLKMDFRTEKDTFQWFLLANYSLSYRLSNIFGYIRKKLWTDNNSYNYAGIVPTTSKDKETITSNLETTSFKWTVIIDLLVHTIYSNYYHSNYLWAIIYTKFSSDVGIFGHFSISCRN